MLYHNVDSDGARVEHADVIKQIDERGLMYPVTAVDGVLVYDGAVSYPAIMRAVNNKLLEQAPATEA